MSLNARLLASNSEGHGMPAVWGTRATQNQGERGIDPARTPDASSSGSTTIR